MPLIQRRAFLTGLVSALAAPAVVRAASIMPVKALPAALERPSPEQLEALLRARMDDAYRVFAQGMAQLLYGSPDAPSLYTGFSWEDP